MRVVLDAEAITSAGHGNSALFRFITSTAPVVGLRLCVPTLVIEEVVANFGRDLDKNIRTLGTALKALSRNLDRTLPSPTAGLQRRDEVTLYRERLTASLGGCTVLPYPNCSHEDLVARSLARRKPFDDRGSGFRDTLLWLSILELAADDGDAVVLVTRDKDFANKDGGLHSDLASEIERRGLAREAVTLVQSLEAVVDVHIRPRLKRRLVAEPVRILEHLGLDPESAVAEAFESVEDRAWSWLELGLPEDFEVVELDTVQDIVDTEVTDVREVPDGKSLIRIESTVECVFSSFVHPALALMPDEMDVHDVEMEVYDVDWAEGYASVGITRQLRCEIDLHVDLSGSGKRSVEVLSLEPVT